MEFASEFLFFCWRFCVKQKLLVTLCAGDGGGDDFDDLPVEVVDAVSDFFDGEFVDFGVADDAAFADIAAAGFELWLDQDHRFSDRGGSGEDGSEKERCRDKGDVHDKQSEFGLPGLAERFGSEEAGIGTLDEMNPCVVAELNGNLTEAGVDGGNMRRATLQKAVSKAASGGAYIKASATGDFDLPVIEGGLEFEATAADVGHVIAEKSKCGIGSDGGAGLVDLLFVDEYSAGKDECTGALTALDEASVNEEKIDAGFDGVSQGSSSFWDQVWRDGFRLRSPANPDDMQPTSCPILLLPGLYGQVSRNQRLTEQGPWQRFDFILLSRRDL